jgi:DNA-binding NarL/FixJ family response regulator
MEKIRILLAEDEAITRMALSRMLNSFSKFQVAGEVCDGRELVEKYLVLKPDIVLSDIIMPVMNGIEASSKIISHDKYARILLLTVHDGDEYMGSAIMSGVSGFVSKFLPDVELRNAIQRVYEGGNYFPGKNLKEIEELRLKRGKDNILINYQELTKREKEILKLVADGLTSDEISERLIISKRTVDNHRFSIKEKIGLSKRSEIIDLVKKLSNSGSLIRK